MRRLAALFLSLPITDKAKAITLAARCLALRLSLRRRTVQDVVASLPRGLGGDRSTDRVYDLADLASAVAYGRKRCLGRSLLLITLLPAGAVLKIGVRRGTPGIDSHAWVEIDASPLRESPADFVEILSLAAP
jgi:hypothetical protein